MSIGASLKRTPASIALALGACGLLAACGGSSTTGTTSGSAAASAGASTSPSALSGSTGAHVGASGSNGSSSAGKSAGGTGTTSAPGKSSAESRNTQTHTTESAPVPAKSINSTLKGAINTFIGCMGEHGEHLPKPNYSGNATEVLSDKGVNTHTPQFESALNACGTDLIAILRDGGASIGAGTPGG